MTKTCDILTSAWTIHPQNSNSTGESQLLNNFELKENIRVELENMGVCLYIHKWKYIHNVHYKESTIYITHDDKNESKLKC